MKIKIIQNDEIVRVYHHARDITVKPVKKLVNILSENGTIIDQYELIDRKLGWLEDKDIDTAEITLTLTVGDRKTQ